MHRNVKLLLLLVLSIPAAILLNSGLNAATTPAWMSRPGTIAHALSLPDGSHVCLDSEVVDKIRAKQTVPYFVIHECFSSGDRLVVLTPPSPDLRMGQTIDVEGTITTLQGGCRAIVSPTVLAIRTETESCCTTALL